MEKTPYDKILEKRLDGNFSEAREIYKNLKLFEVEKFNSDTLKRYNERNGNEMFVFRQQMENNNVNDALAQWKGINSEKQS